MAKNWTIGNGKLLRKAYGNATIIMSNETRYADFESGSDLTGDGSRLNPFKTITKTSKGLCGSGNKVRVGKGPAHSQLTGTFSFTKGSETVQTSHDLRGSLSAKDFFRRYGSSELPWEVQSVSENSITLIRKYSGISETYACEKIGIISTGTASSGEDVQKVLSCGPYGFDRLYNPETEGIEISGGWDLSQNPPVQNGETWFRQAGDNQYGVGLNQKGKNGLFIEKLNFLRYSKGIANDAANRFIRIEDCIAVCWDVGIELLKANHGHILSSKALAAVTGGKSFNLQQSAECSLRSSEAYMDRGVYVEECTNLKISGLTYAHDQNVNIYPVYLVDSHDILILGGDFANRKIFSASTCYRNRAIGINNLSGIATDNLGYSSQPLIIVENCPPYYTEHAQMAMFSQAKVNTSGDISGNWLQFHGFKNLFPGNDFSIQIPAHANTDMEVHLWTKHESGNTGQGYLAAYYKGKALLGNRKEDTQAIPVSMVWAENVLEIDGSDIDEDGAIEFHIFWSDYLGPPLAIDKLHWVYL